MRKKNKDFKCLENCKFDHKSEFGSIGEFKAFINKFAIRCIIQNCDQKCSFVHVSPFSQKAVVDVKKKPKKVWVIRERKTKIPEHKHESKIEGSMIMQATADEHKSVYPVYLSEDSSTQNANAVACSGKFYFPNHSNYQGLTVFVDVDGKRWPLNVQDGDPDKFSLTRAGTVVNCPIPPQIQHIPQLKLANSPGKTDDEVKLVWKWAGKNFISSGKVLDGDSLTTSCSAHVGVCCAPYINEHGRVVGFHMWGKRDNSHNGAGFPGRHYSNNEEFVLVESVDFAEEYFGAVTDLDYENPFQNEHVDF